MYILYCIYTNSIKLRSSFFRILRPRASTQCCRLVVNDGIRFSGDMLFPLQGHRKLKGIEALHRSSHRIQFVSVSKRSALSLLTVSNSSQRMKMFTLAVIFLSCVLLSLTFALCSSRSSFSFRSINCPTTSYFLRGRTQCQFENQSGKFSYFLLPAFHNLAFFSQGRRFSSITTERMSDGCAWTVTLPWENVKSHITINFQQNEKKTSLNTRPTNV